MNRNIAVAIAIICALSAIAFIQPAFATTYCINNSYIGENTTIYDQQTGASLLALHSEDYCANGCDSKLLRCNPSEWESMTGPVGNWGLFPMIAIFIFVIIGLMYFASRHH